ncbi:MAG: GGDEF domain-containing protein [Candidatus Dojkabacteria bacterium]
MVDKNIRTGIYIILLVTGVFYLSYAGYKEDVWTVSVTAGMIILLLAGLVANIVQYEKVRYVVTSLALLCIIGLIITTPSSFFLLAIVSVIFSLTLLGVVYAVLGTGIYSVVYTVLAWYGITQFNFVHVLLATAILGMSVYTSVFLERLIGRKDSHIQKVETNLVDLQKIHSKSNKALQQISQHADQIQIINEMSGVLQSCVCEEEAYIVISAALGKLFPHDRGEVYVIKNENDLVYKVAYWGDAVEARTILQTSDCWCLRRGHPHVAIEEEGAMKCVHNSTPGCDICIPMSAQGKSIGFMHLRCGENDESLRLDVDKRRRSSRYQLCVAVASTIALALSNIALRKKLEQQAEKDPLTDVYNRRYMEKQLSIEVRDTPEMEHTVGIILLDIDYFKHFNDTFGHEAGDVLLREIGLLLKRLVRESDIVCRYGGEEFLVIMPGSDVKVLKDRAEEVRDEVQRMSVYYNNSYLPSVTVSCGIAEYPSHAVTVEDLISAADSALYFAKSSGRNRVIIATVVESSRIPALGTGIR